MTPDEIKVILASDELTDEIHDWFYSEWPNAGWPKFITIDEMNIIQAIVWKTYQKGIRDGQPVKVKVAKLSVPYGSMEKYYHQCTRCKRDIMKDFEFCPYCGVPLDQSE